MATAELPETFKWIWNRFKDDSWEWHQSFHYLTSNTRHRETSVFVTKKHVQSLIKSNKSIKPVKLIQKPLKKWKSFHHSEIPTVLIGIHQGNIRDPPGDHSGSTKGTLVILAIDARGRSSWWGYVVMASLLQGSKGFWEVASCLNVKPHLLLPAAR